MALQGKLQYNDKDYCWGTALCKIIATDIDIVGHTEINPPYTTISDAHQLPLLTVVNVTGVLSHVQRSLTSTGACIVCRMYMT